LLSSLIVVLLTKPLLHCSIHPNLNSTVVVISLVAEAERVETAQTIKPRRSVQQAAGKTTPATYCVR